MRLPSAAATGRIVAGLAGIGMLAGGTLPWLSAGTSHLHWHELATSPLLVERTLALGCAIGLLAALAPLVRPRNPGAWQVAFCAAALAAACAARLIGFAIARALEGEAAAGRLGVGAGAVALVAMAIAALTASRAIALRNRLAASTLAVGLTLSGLLPVGRAGGLIVDELTGALASLDGGRLATAIGLQQAATLIAFAALVHVVAADGQRRRMRLAALAASAACAVLSTAAIVAWTRLDGASLAWNPSLAVAGVVAGACMAPVRRPRPTSPDPGSRETT